MDQKLMAAMATERMMVITSGLVPVILLGAAVVDSPEELAVALEKFQDKDAATLAPLLLEDLRVLCPGAEPREVLQAGFDAVPKTWTNPGGVAGLVVFILRAIAKHAGCTIDTQEVDEIVKAGKAENETQHMLGHALLLVRKENQSTFDPVLN